MHFDFEAAAISISIGVVVAVLLQGTLLDHADAANVPPRVRRALQASDIWLAIVFVLVVGVTIATPVVALTNGRPLKIGDRRAVAHLLFVAAAYPALIAIVRRTLPILFSRPSPDTPWASPRMQLSVLLIPLLGSIAAIFLLDGLVDPRVSFSDALLRIALVGAVVAGPAIAVPSLAGWRARRSRRRGRAVARERRLVEQTVFGTLPHGGGELRVRAFFSRSGATACWIDRNEAARVVGAFGEAVWRARREGIDVIGTDRWWLHAWPNRRLSVRHGRVKGTPRRAWPCEDGCLFEAGALLASLAARMPLSDRAASSDPQ